MTQIKKQEDLLKERLETEEGIMMTAMTHLIHRHNLHHELALEIQKVAKDKNVDEDVFRELAGPARQS